MANKEQPSITERVTQPVAVGVATARLFGSLLSRRLVGRGFSEEPPDFQVEVAPLEEETSDGPPVSQSPLLDAVRSVRRKRFERERIESAEPERRSSRYSSISSAYAKRVEEARVRLDGNLKVSD